MKRRLRREQLEDVILVESYKDYNGHSGTWYNQQCCAIF